MFTFHGLDDSGNAIFEPQVEPWVVRTTDRNNFKKCRRLWQYTSPLQLFELEPTRVNKNLAFGIALHKGWETFYDPENQQLDLQARTDLACAAILSEFKRQAKVEGDLSTEREEEYEEMIQLGLGMMRNYTKYAAKADKGWTFKAVEAKYQVPVVEADGSLMIVDGRPVVYQVRIDVLAEDSNGGLWIWDHKTAAYVTGDVRFLDNDTQISAYLLAVQAALGVVLEGIVYNEAAKSVPSKPKQLKNGSLSQDKRQSTTYDLYVEAITELGLDSEPYGAILEFLRYKEDAFFRRTLIRRTQRELRYQNQLLLMEVRDMLSNPSIYPNPSKMHCGGCDFFYPCLVENELGDVDFVLSGPAYRTRQGEG